jgi:hypothetical protein
MRELRQSTQVLAVIGPVVAVGDGFTPVTTLSLSTADEAEILKHDTGTVTSISGATFAAITKAQDNTRFQGSPWMKMLRALMEFKDERTGKNFGNAGDWGTDKVLVIDSLSGLTQASRQNVAGNRPALSPSDYGLAQRQLEGLINQICTAFRCHFVLTAHAERELDPVLGGQKIMASTIGKALAPTLPRYFTDNVLTKRSGAKFEWDTADTQAVLKARNVPIGSNLPPTFVPLIGEWKKRGGIIEVPEVVVTQ